MQLTKWSPFMDIEKTDELSLAGFAPAMDIYQTKDKVVVETSVPNLDPSKVSVSIENDILTIEGKSEKRSEVEDKDYYRKEVRTGIFHRTILMPVSVQGDKAKAIYENGMLKISVPKAKQIKKNKINIEVK